MKKTHHPLRILVAVLLALATAFFAAPLYGASLPAPPCNQTPYPPYAQVGAPPKTQIWTEAQLSGNWSPPSCVSFHDTDTSLLAAVAGTFQSDADPDAMLLRLGEISKMKDMQYWSVADKKWNSMFLRAVALKNQDPHSERNNFSAKELRSGQDLYFLTADNRSKEDIVTRLHVSIKDSDHMVIETTNVTPLRWHFVTMTKPGNFQTWYFLERQGGAWRFYSLTRIAYESATAKLLPAASSINRAVAMYRHYAGIPTDADPPPSP